MVTLYSTIAASQVPNVYYALSIAKDLGISGTSLRNWVKQAQIDQGEREGLTTEEREELRRLRRENRVLKQERDFLKKLGRQILLDPGHDLL